MGSIYVHIPYCTKVCNYCDFHFSASLKNKADLIEALCSEIKLRKDYLPDKKIETLYFGGGTPSVLTAREISKILNCISGEFDLSGLSEFTFEANPDDLTIDYLSDLKSMGINRLSIGIQSFSDDDLKWMNRRHTSEEAYNSVVHAKGVGFSNITIDLIYGLPVSNISVLKDNLDKFYSLEIPHLSAYHLSIEPKTVLGVWQKRGRIKEISEEESVAQYDLLLESLEKHGYINYEISNFCKDGFLSKHNTNYWYQGNYIGFGPSAHSYNGVNRQWNISVNQDYIDNINNNKAYFENEILTPTDKFNDYLLTRLRTIWGINLNEIGVLFGDNYKDYILKEIEKLVNADLLIMDQNKIYLTKRGKLLSNQVITDLIYVD
jgi:oxygen-independent coproporphyrinogen III oxidase